MLHTLRRKLMIYRGDRISRDNNGDSLIRLPKYKLSNTVWSTTVSVIIIIFHGRDIGDTPTVITVYEVAKPRHEYRSPLRVRKLRFSYRPSSPRQPVTRGFIN